MKNDDNVVETGNEKDDVGMCAQDGVTMVWGHPLIAIWLGNDFVANLIWVNPGRRKIDSPGKFDFFLCIQSSHVNGARWSFWDLHAWNISSRFRSFEDV